MDLNRYDQKIRDLYAEYSHYAQMSDPRSHRVLLRMKKEALLLNDDALLGNVYYSFAFTDYFTLGKYQSYLKHLRLAAKHMVRGDPDELGRVYYLVALDALNKGVNDIAANYFLSARDLFVAHGQETSAGIMDDSVGHVLMLIGAYREARVYFRRALRAIRKDKTHPHYYSNVAGIRINDGLACLELGRIKNAREALEKTERFLSAHKEQFQIGTRFAIALFRARMAAFDGKTVQVMKEIETLHALADEMKQITGYAEHFRSLAMTLLSQDHPEAVWKLLQLMDAHPPMEDATVARRIIAEIRVAYYLWTGDEKELALAYQEQDRIFLQMREERGRVFLYTRELIRLIGDLRAEQEQVRREHDALLGRVKRDALTGIPNRYAMNEELEKTFDHAWKKRMTLGVALMDVDGLKAYNDKYGHPAGDTCLMQIGDALSRIAEAEGFFASRYGGDEFVLIFEDRTDGEILRICEALQGQMPLSISVGICNAVPVERDKSFDYLSAADRAMYRAKRRPRGSRLELCPDLTG